MRWPINITVFLVASTAMPSIIRSGESATEDAVRQNTPRTLEELIEYATRREHEVRTHIRDYSCLITKRERINGTLQAYRFIEATVRPAGTRNGKPVPLAVHMRFLKPSTVAGRTIVFVEGQNDGKMIVRRGGKRFSDVTVKVDPESELARTETLMHIADLGFDRMLSEISAQLRKDIEADPTGENTELVVFENAKINDRACTSVQITHPRFHEKLLYHRAEFFIDKEYRLPVRIVAYDWPRSDGEKPRILGEFTYTHVKINLGLTDSDFDPALLTAAR